MTLYRIEHQEDFSGPFWYKDHGECRHLDAYRMPVPTVVGLDDTVDSWAETRYACESLGQLLRWFTPTDRAELAPQGFVVAKYYCPPHRCRVASDRSQIAFDFGSAIRVGQLSVRGAAR